MFTFQIFISQISGPIPMCIALCSVAIALYIFHDSKEFYKVFFTTVLAMCITYTLKYLLQVPRPLNMLVTEHDYRFPSGHATMAAVVMSLSIHYVHLHIKNKILKRTLHTLATGWFVLVSYSRIYLHAHYSIDIMAGGLIGIFSTILILKIFKHLHYYKK